MNKLHKLNYLSLLYFILRSSFLSILTPLLLKLKYEGFFVMMIGIIVGFLLFMVYVSFTSHDPNSGLFDHIENFFGKKIGFILNTLFMISMLFYMALLFLNLTNFIYTEFLNDTSFYILLFLIFLFVFYVTTKDMETLCKSSFLFFILSILLFVIKFLGIFSDINFSYITSSHLHHSYIKEWLSYGLYSITPLFCLSIIPMNNIKNNENIKKYQIFTYFFTSLMLLLSLFFILTVLGPNLANAYYFPEFHLLKSVKILGFIEKIESILSMGFIFDMYLCLVLLSFTLKSYMKKYFHFYFFPISFILLFFFCSFYSLSNIQFLVEITFYLFLISFLIFTFIYFKNKKE